MKQSGHNSATLLVVAFGITASVAAHAQTAPQSLQVSPLPHITPQAAPQLGAALPNFQPLGTEAAMPNAVIPVKTVTIAGATAFPAARLNALTAGLAGQTVPLAKLEAARHAMVTLYRSHGYIFSTVSVTVDAQGDVEFIVTEGHIAEVKLSQDIGPAGSAVLGFLNHLTTERPVREASLEHWLLLAQQVPGVSVHAVLRADHDDPGALTLIAEVSKQTVSGLITADDRGFSGTGPTEALLVGDVNSATALGDQTEISLYHTSGSTDNFGQAAESFFIGTHGLRLRLYGGTGRAWPSGALHSIGYESRVTVFGAALSYPVLLRRNQSLTATLHFDATDDEINTAGLRTSTDSLRVARLAGNYAWQDIWAGPARDALSIFNLQASQGLPGLGASRNGRALGVAGRYRAQMQFWKLNGALGRTQTLFTPTPDSVLSLRLESGGQYTGEILPSEEEFGLGGTRFTRGFYAGEVSGDNAAYATAELQLNTGYTVNLFSHPADLGVQYYTFYDWGESWSHLRSDANHKVESAGGGIRLGLTRNVELDGEAVHRLTTNLAPGAPKILPLSETVIYWGVTARY
jgi:hemolysin activation/secretion protein